MWLILVGAVEPWPAEVRKSGARIEGASLPSSLPAPSCALHTFLWIPSCFSGLVSLIWALTARFLLSSPALGQVAIYFCRGIVPGIAINIYSGFELIYCLS